MTTETKPEAPNGDEGGPTIFGRPMTRRPNEWGWIVWGFQIPGAMRVRIWGAAADGTEWHWDFDDADHVARSADEAARAIERRILGLVLALAPLLDDDGKRELVKAARIRFDHFPECKETRDFENEPEPIL